MFSFKDIPPVTKNLLIINVLVYLFTAIIPSSKEALIYNYCALHYFSSPAFNPAQIFTYMFLHGGFIHLFFNMFALIMFGPQIEYSLGSRKFLFYYISCGLGAALIQEGVFAIMLHKYTTMFPPEEFRDIVENGYKALRHGQTYADPTLASINSLVNGISVGASGAIYGVLIAFGMLFPEREIMLIIPPIPLKAKYMVIAFAVAELVLGISASDSIGHFCLLGGMLVGFLIILYWKKKGNLTTFF